jgi:hypothetical protein
VIIGDHVANSHCLALRNQGEGASEFTRDETTGESNLNLAGTQRHEERTGDSSSL